MYYTFSTLQWTLRCLPTDGVIRQQVTTREVWICNKVFHLRRIGLVLDLFFIGRWNVWMCREMAPLENSKRLQIFPVVQGVSLVDVRVWLLCASLLILHSSSTSARCSHRRLEFVNFPTDGVTCRFPTTWGFYKCKKDLLEQRTILGKLVKCWKVARWCLEPQNKITKRVLF